MDTQPQVALVTGASSGIGRLCALHLTEAGYKVYGTSRRAPLPDSLVSLAIRRTFRLDD